ncbi:MAG: amidohydrolase family protein [bacterium]|nr:amidohydrolase family protein [bacterium]
MPTHQPRYSKEEKNNVKTVLIKDGSYILTTDENDEVAVSRAKSILIKDGIIQKIMPAGEEQSLIKDVDLVYDAGLRGGIVLTPGFINAHAHPPMYLLRSATLLRNEFSTTEESLVVARKIEQAMSTEDQTTAALGDFTEQQKMGTTFVLSHYHTPAATRAAAREAKIRLVDAVSIASKTDPNASLEKAVQTFSDVDELISPGLTIHTMERASVAELKSVKQVMEKYQNVILTIHCGETVAEVESSIKKHGKRPIEVLAEAGLLNERLVLSHAVHFTSDEIKLLVEHNVGVVHLPTSNRIHKSGEFKYAEFFAHNGTKKIALGTDSVISKSKLDIVSEAFQSKMLHQNSTYPVSYGTLFKMMTINGARVLNQDATVGKILPGYKADISFWKLKDRAFIPYDFENPETLIGNLISHAGNTVRDLMINGQFVISNRKHALINESKLLEELQQRHIQLRDRIG